MSRVSDRAGVDPHAVENNSHSSPRTSPPSATAKHFPHRPDSDLDRVPERHYKRTDAAIPSARNDHGGGNGQARRVGFGGYLRRLLRAERARRARNDSVERGL